DNGCGDGIRYLLCNAVLTQAGVDAPPKLATERAKGKGPPDAHELRKICLLILQTTGCDPGGKSGRF
ncbi:MAG: hypothetical protein LOD87_15430, partial [Planifilum fulgidum]